MARCYPERCTAEPKGEYGGDVYGDGSAGCQTFPFSGYGGDGNECSPLGEVDPCFVGTITRMTSRIWIGHRAPLFGGSTFTAKTYPECLKLMQLAVSRRLSASTVDNTGQPQVTYLRLPT
ncbi:MAG: hypothetical protein ACYTEQ_12225 [Planctomycetota bacterium]|jgi:hypothetical protein